MIKLIINLEKDNIEIPVSVLAKDNAGFIGNCMLSYAFYSRKLRGYKHYQIKMFSPLSFYLISENLVKLNDQK